jgi:hypothetical protein
MYFSGSAMLLVGFLLLGLVVFPYVNPKTNEFFYGNYYYADFSPAFTSISQSQTVLLEVNVYGDGASYPDFVSYRWTIDGRIVQQGQSGFYDSFVVAGSGFSVGSHSVEVSVEVMGAVYDQIICYGTLEVTGVSQPSPTPTLTPTPTPSSTPSATPTPSISPTPTGATPKPSTSPNPTLKPSPTSTPIIDVKVIVENKDFQIVASILCFPLIALGFVTVWVAKKKR